MRALLAIAVLGTALGIGHASAWAVPAPCGGTAHIDDASGDGHHANTDVTGAWFSEDGGVVRATVRVRNALWEPAHDPPEVAGVAVLYEVGGTIRYVRVEAPPPGSPLRFDYGTWTPGGGFATAGPTTGTTTTGAGGSVTIDVPAAAGAVAGTVLAQPFVLTYDGYEGSGVHWVDRAPGGTSPSDAVWGRDFRVGSCTGGGGGGGNGPGGNSQQIHTVELDAPARVGGGGRAKVTGRVVPARAGVAVEVVGTGYRKRTVTKVVTAADGRFSTTLAIRQTTVLRASAEGIGSQSRRVTVVSTVRIAIQRVKGAVVVRGRVAPRVPGRIALRRLVGAYPKVIATAKVRDGRFRIRLSNARRGRYRAVFIPSNGRAERSTSNTGAVK